MTVIDPNHLLSAIHHSTGPGSYAALRIVGEVRIEMGQLASLIEAAIGEGEEARHLDDAHRRRGFNIARAARDIADVNARMLGQIEGALMARTHHSSEAAAHPVDCGNPL
jgi:hypothetical protein